MLTTDADTLPEFQGGEGDDTYIADLGLIDGDLTNTLQAADILDGGEGANVLNVQLIPTATLEDFGSYVAIDPTTDNIQVVNVQVQSPSLDFVTGAAIDAQSMADVQQWWSVESRAILQIDDIRSAPEETFFGMRETDAGVGYNAFFNANEVDADSSTNVVLDGAGAGAQGGTINVGVMGGGLNGISEFNVQVDGASHLTGMISNALNGFGGNTGLEVVNLASVDSDSDLLLGTPVLASVDGRVIGGLTDVREVNAEGFEGMLNIGINLNNTNNFIDSYFDDGETDFVYTGGDGGNIFTINAAGIPAIQGDPDFSMDVTGGDSDDRFNLVSIGRKDGVSIDGEGGSNTVELTTSTGVMANGNDVFAGFDNIQNLVVAGGGTTQDIVEGNMLGLETITIATPAPSGNTTVINLEAETDVTISGKNQTGGLAGSGNSNADQFFGTIDFQEAQGDSLNVDLDNTARADGVMTVGSLMIDGQSSIEDITIVSGGQRDTSNIVQDFKAPAADTVNLTGTQDLAFHVSDLANPNGQELTVSASALEGDLTLAMNAGLLVGGDEDVITGTEGENDLLALYGATGDIDTTIDGIETVQFGWNTGSDIGGLFGDNIDGGAGGTDAATTPITFDAANAADTDTYVIALRGANNGITLDNLASETEVILGDETSGVGVFMTTADNTLNAASGGSLDLTWTDIVLNGATTSVNGFETINFDVASTGGARTHNLAMDGDARTLNVTGGDEDAAGDELTLGSDLLASLTTIDVTGYEGKVTATVGPDELSGTDMDVIAGDEDLDFTMAEPFDTFSFTVSVDSASGPGGKNLVVTLDNGDVIEFDVGGGPSSNATTVAEDLADLTGPDSWTVANESGTWDITNDGTDVTFNFRPDDQSFVLDQINTITANTGGGASVTYSLDENVEKIDVMPDYNTTFKFTDGSSDSDWTIDNFIADADAGAGANNYSVLDVSDLGIGSFADLDFDDSTSDLIITEEGGVSDWSITLVGVDNENDVAPSENFIFA
ncbi:MAG: hypothetical protein LC687_01030 [Actinobacteria bacterium]|nr:hypothetical protein [Actinomycetota bacterium]